MSFRAGVAWNLVSFALMGISGVLLNVLVAKYYVSTVLGVFNQVFAIYIMASQLAVFGVHYSLLHYGSTLADQDPKSAGESTVSALLIVSVIAFLITIATGVLREPIGAFLQSPRVATGIAWALPGLFLFPLNKTLLAALNSHRRMQAYAIGNASRYLLIITGVWIIAAHGLPGEYLPGALSLAELLLYLGLQVTCFPLLAKPDYPTLKYWVASHLRFGSQGMVAGLLAELNTRIDVLLLGYFQTDATVGIYSFVAILAEGALQLLMVLRVNYDPVLARLVAAKNWPELEKLLAKGKITTYALMLPLGFLGMALYPQVIHTLGFAPEYGVAGQSLSILLGGILLSAGYVPFGGLLQQAGYPGLQSWLIFGVALMNAVGNLVLIPFLGMNGAALATAVAQVSFALLLKAFARKQLNIRF